MDILLPEFKNMLLTMIKNEVDFLLIGGYAVIYYGYERTTGDMDIWLNPDNENRDKLVKAFRDFGIINEDLKALKNVDFTTTNAFFFGKKPRRIDFLTKISGVSYNEAVVKANHFPLGDKQIPIIHYDHLILSKITTGRAQDKADIDILQKINRYKKS